VSTTKNAVQVFIAGESFTVRSELPPEYTREVAAYLDAAFRHVKSTMPSVETHKAAILAALQITDELFQARRGDRDGAARLTALLDDVARLLPPTKRGGRAAGHLGGGSGHEAPSSSTVMWSLVNTQISAAMRSERSTVSRAESAASGRSARAAARA